MTAAGDEIAFMPGGLSTQRQHHEAQKKKKQTAHQRTYRRIRAYRPHETGGQADQTGEVFMRETNTKPAWIIEAEKHIGLREIKGPAHAPKITEWLIRLKAWWRDDETPWCGVFVAACLNETGIDIPKHWYRAKAYLDWGLTIHTPCYGCIAVFERKGGGHVGFVVGIDQFDRLLILGGNQGDKVSVAPFEMHRVAGYRIPTNILEVQPLPQMNIYAASSRNEA